MENIYKYSINGEWIINPRVKVNNDGNNENNFYIILKFSFYLKYLFNI